MKPGVIQYVERFEATVIADVDREMRKTRRRGARVDVTSEHARSGS